MIDVDVFETWIGILSDRFNRPLATPTIQAFYLTLPDQLTTEEFLVGAKRAFDECSFWPTPKEIIDFAKPPALAKAAGADVFRDILTWNGRDNMMAEARKRLDDAGMQAFLAMGGPPRLRNMKVDDELWARKEFVELYEAAIANLDSMSKAERARLSAHRYPVLANTDGPRIDKGPEQTAALLPSIMKQIEDMR